MAGGFPMRTSSWFHAVAVAVGLLLVTDTALAIARIDVTPRTASADAAGSVTVTWSVSAAPGPARSVVSPGGRFILDGGASGVIGTTGPLSAQTASAGRTDAMFVETVDLPPGLLDAARARGASRILYVRSFEASYSVLIFPSVGAPTPQNALTSAEAAVVFDLGSTMAGPLALFRAQLRFDDGSALRVLPQNERLRAFLDVSYRGGGVLEGIWELADAGTTSGEPVFVPLQRVRRALGAGQRLTLDAPRLPTAQTGLHILRFRFETPNTGIAAPFARYHVTIGNAVVPLAVTAPGMGSPLDATTRFAWESAPGAIAYRLELLEAPLDTAAPLFSDRAFNDARGVGSESLGFESADTGWEDDAPFDAAMLVSSRQLEALVSAATLRHLEPGRRYRWRVRAIAADGSTLGLSESRLVQTAPASE